MRASSIVASVLLISGVSFAQTAIHAGRLLDVRTGASRINIYIMVRGDQIESVSSKTPSDAKIIDLSGLTVLPGLCDCHAHTVYDPKDESTTAYLTMSSAQAALWGARNVREWLNRGFTML